jgi:hypothetical protein
MTRDLARALVAEAIRTFALVFARAAPSWLTLERISWGTLAPRSRLAS